MKVELRGRTGTSVKYWTEETGTRVVAFNVFSAETIDWLQSLSDDELRLWLHGYETGRRN